MRYAIVIEKTNANYSAYVPDLPGCVATAATVLEVKDEIREAVRFHIEGLNEDGLAAPTPISIACTEFPQLPHWHQPGVRSDYRVVEYTPQALLRVSYAKFNYPGNSAAS